MHLISGTPPLTRVSREPLPPPVLASPSGPRSSQDLCDLPSIFLGHLLSRPQGGITPTLWLNSCSSKVPRTNRLGHLVLPTPAPQLQGSGPSPGASPRALQLIAPGRPTHTWQPRLVIKLHSRSFFPSQGPSCSSLLGSGPPSD